MNNFKNIFLPLILMVAAFAFIIGMIFLSVKPEIVTMNIMYIFLGAIVVLGGFSVFAISKWI